MAELSNIPKSLSTHCTSLGCSSNPTGQFLAPEKLRGCGALLLDDSGRRFVDELATRDVVTAAITAQPRHSAWLLLGAQGAARYGEGTLGFYSSKKLVTKVSGGEGGRLRVQGTARAQDKGAALVLR
jgi:hypothetical protein